MSFHEVNLHPSRKVNIRVLAIANLISGLIYGFYNVILQPFIVQLIEMTGKHVKPEETLGMIMTVASVIQVIPMLFAAKISDKIGRKRVLVGSFLFFPIAMILFGISGMLSVKYPFLYYSSGANFPQKLITLFNTTTTSFPVTYGLAVAFLGLSCMSFAFGFGDPAGSALIAESAEKQKTASSFSLINMAFYATGLIGPLVIRILTNKIEIWVYFFILAVLRGIMFIYQLFALKEPHIIKDYSPSIFKQFIQSLKAIYQMFFQLLQSIYLYLYLPFFYLIRSFLKWLYSRFNKFQKFENFLSKGISKMDRHKHLEEAKTHIILLRDIFRNPGVPYAIGFFILDAFTWGLSISIFWGSVVTQYSFDEGDIAILQLVLNISTLIFFIPVTKISDKLKKTQLLILSELVGSLLFTTNIIAYFTLPQYRLYIIMIGWIGLGGSIAFWMPGIMSIITNFDKKRRAETYGIVQGLHSLGWFPTSFLAGIIISRVNFLTVFVISLILFPFNVLMAWKLPVKEDQVEEEEEEE